MAERQMVILHRFEEACLVQGLWRLYRPVQERCGSSGVSLSMSAIRLSSGNERAFIFRIKLVRCTFTVDSAVPISSAICLFRRPRMTSIMISRSRELRVSERPLRPPKALSLSRRARSRAMPASTAWMRS